MGTHGSKRSAPAGLFSTSAAFGLLAFGFWQPAAAQTVVDSAIIDNGVVQLGINEFGTLIAPAAGSVNGAIGITYLPSEAAGGRGDALAPGCDCEGWGLADFTNPASGFGRSQSNGDTGTGTATLTVSGTGTNALSNGSSAVSTTNITVGGNPFAEVVHDFSPSVSTNLYRVDVSITNTGTAAIGDLRYRRVMDWDVPPTEFSEFVTIQGWPAANLVNSTDNGFNDPNPLTPLTSIAPGTVDQNFEHNGPDDHGAAFDFSFATLAPGATQEFVIYYGAAGNVVDSLKALADVGAEVYSLGTASDTPDSDSVTGTPNTFIFAFSGVGGTPVGPMAPISVGSLGVMRQVAALVTRHQMEAVGMRMDGLVGGGDNLPFQIGKLAEGDAAGAEELGGLKLFATAGGSFGKLQSVRSASADFSMSQINFGADYTILPDAHWVSAVNFGVAIGFANADADGRNRLDVDLKSTTVSAFAGLNFLSGGYANLVGSYTWSDYDIRRRLAGASFGGKTDGDEVGVLFRLGYDVPVNVTEERLISVGPYFIATYIDGEIDPFTERSSTSPATALEYGRRKFESATTQLGGRVNVAAKTSWGAAGLTGNVGWEHQFSDGGRPGVVATAGGLPTLAPFDLKSHDYARLGARAWTKVGANVALAAEYDGAIGGHMEDHSFRGRVRVGF
ncbi:autotransporter outer membrane beta-barrel domain-containing protein [Methylopila henanensis]|uniref:Autotransporter outer membrane beta-barrel domain-containing protein n=1 Tax=Methylopila henanensis TaxID=873516 RepID=A0ABW4K5N0_9HYPH